MNRQTLYRAELLHDADRSDFVCSSGEQDTFLLPIAGSCSLPELEQSICGIHDLIYLPPYQTVVIRPMSGAQPLSMLVMGYSRELLDSLSDEENHLRGFLGAMMVGCQVVHAACAPLALAKTLIQNLISLPQSAPPYGASVYEKGVLGVLIVTLIQAMNMSGAADCRQKARTRNTFSTDEVLAYIAEHITEEISLERLEKHFFISRSYISREFKKTVGETVHGYILKTKLDMCKRYIAQGVPITEVYKMMGVGGYNHFFRAFKNEYGMTPKEYYRRMNGRIPK